MNPYLVLRGQFKHSDIRKVTGIDSLVDYDYMGSSEYEFGALFRSLKRIVPARAEYSVANTNIHAANGHDLFLFCKNGQWADTCDAVNQLVANKLRLKEPSYMDRAVHGEDDRRFPCRADFWWDIEHDWMAWLNKKHNSLVPLALEKVAEKWEKEKK